MLILSGGGDEVQSYLHHRAFAALLSNDRPLLHIPGGAYPVEISEKWIAGVMSEFGVTGVCTWAPWTETSAPNSAEYAGFYVGGGNTFFLLYHLRRTKFDQQIRRAARAGMPYFGGSAGAVLMGSHLATCEHMDSNDIGLKPALGLNLLRGAAVWCHYAGSDGNQIPFLLQGNPSVSAVLALAEDACVQVTPEGEILAGPAADVVLFLRKGKRVYAPGETISLD